MNSTRTPKGTELPLIDLRGKPYLQVAHRFIWFNEEVENFEINTELLLVTDEQTIARSTVSVKDKSGNVVKKASATKRETKKDFSDHTEKAETSSVGRALAMLGYGTQFAIQELDEGERLADSPVVDTRKYLEKTDGAKKTSVKVGKAVAQPEDKKATETTSAKTEESGSQAPQTEGVTTFNKKFAQGKAAAGNDSEPKKSKGGW